MSVHFARVLLALAQLSDPNRHHRLADSAANEDVDFWEGILYGLNSLVRVGEAELHYSEDSWTIDFHMGFEMLAFAFGRLTLEDKPLGSGVLRIADSSIRVVLTLRRIPEFRTTVKVDKFLLERFGDIALYCSDPEYNGRDLSKYEPHVLEAAEDMGVMTGTKFQGRQEFAKVWSRVTRKVHLQLLATPSPRMLQPDPNPKYYKPFPVRIEKATLNHLASKRLKLLSQVPPGKFTEKYQPPIPSEHYVTEHNLSYTPTQRIEELSMPRSKFKKKEKKKIPKKQMRKSTLKKGQKSQKAISAHKEWLELRAAPRPTPVPPPIPKYERRTEPLSEEERAMRIVELAHPPPRYLYKPPPWDPYEVSKKAQKAITTKRIVELSQPTELPEEAKLDLAFKPFTIKKSALRYRVTKRIKVLSEPVVQRKAVDNDVKEDAFTVPKRALKAVCSKRTRELAKPVTRKGVD